MGDLGFEPHMERGHELLPRLLRCRSRCALLVRRSEWILNHFVRNDFVVELDNRVIKTSPYESHTGNPAPRSTSLLNRILVGRRDDDDKQPRFQQAWFLGLIAGSDGVIALHPDGMQCHHGEWRVNPLDDPASNL